MRLVNGFESNIVEPQSLFNTELIWDRIYITTVFTFNFRSTISIINKYKAALGGNLNRMFVGGIMASLMPEEIADATGIYPITGLLRSPDKLRLKEKKYFEGITDIDSLTPDYSVVSESNLYAIYDTYYSYSTRGCIQDCAWCGVKSIEPQYASYIDIKPVINDFRLQYGDKPKLKLMDNNILPSPHLDRIIADLVELGYGRDSTTENNRQRLVDFNQGLDASFINENTMDLLSNINIKPMRIAFDRLSEKSTYIAALETAERFVSLFTKLTPA